MTINIFIGTEPKTEIARKVLEFSILKHTKQKTLFHPMLGDDWRINPPNGVGTGFSLLRWDIPRRMNYEGFAIYLDADIICLGDIKYLYECDVKFPPHAEATSNGLLKSSCWCTYQKCKWYPDKDTPETSVMLIDCEQAKTNQFTLEEILSYLKDDVKRKRYVEVMRAVNHYSPPVRIPNLFNSLNTLNGIVDEDKRTLLLHYTKEDQQPWYNPKHPHKDIWAKYFIEALKDGYVSSSEVKKAISKFEPHEKGKRGIGMHPYWKKFL